VIILTRFIYKLVRGIGEVIEKLRKAERNRVYRVESEVCRGYKSHYDWQTTNLTPWNHPNSENRTRLEDNPEAIPDPHCKHREVNKNHFSLQKLSMWMKSHCPI
jgi:hypothetical protein